MDNLFQHCMKKYSPFLLFVFLIAGGCKEKEKEKSEAGIVNQPGRFIDPPIKGVDVPYKEYKVDATKGETLIHPTGSVLLFPPNSFVDEAGNVVTGNVQVKYREFIDPIDFYLAGIPMQYDSAGHNYQFESSGMMEILAYKDGKPVFVNQKSKPEIYLNSTSNSEGHSLYQLDTVQKKWINKGTMTITQLHGAERSGESSAKISNTKNSITEMEAPVKPMKADNKSPVLEIVIDPNSFKEFAIYKNMKFQVDESKTPFNANDSKEEWNNLELIKANNKGSYMAKFSNANKAVTYAVKPVFEGENYKKALRVFEREYAMYKRGTDEYAKIQKANYALYIKDSIENRQIEEKNKRILLSNQIIEKRNKEIEKQNEIIQKENKRILDENKLDTALMGFSIDGFGVWNCDLANKLNYNFIRAAFKDESGNNLNLTSVAVIVRGINSVISTTPDNFAVVLNSDIMVLGVYNGKFAYVSFEEFRKLNINADTQEQTFIMKVVSEQGNNYNYIKSLMKQ